MKMMGEIKAVDLFCGAGGLTKGLEQAGIDVEAGFDVDEDCKYPYEKNNGADFVHTDVSDLSEEEVASRFDDDSYSLLAGCAPCQPFSRMGRGSDDEKWDLLKDFGRLIEGVEPDLVFMENVPGLRNHSVFDDFLDILDEADYNVDYRVVQCPEFNVPQERRRLVLLASKVDQVEIRKPSEDYNPTVRNAIGDLPKIGAGETHEEDSLHEASDLSEKNLKRIRSSTPGGSWKDWPDELKLDCHKKDSGRKYVSVYGRMEWDKPAPTITTQFYGYGNGRFGHPDQDRAISLREGALLQTFPKDYRFGNEEESISKTKLGKLIGNAVPVKLAENLGGLIKEHVSNN